MRKISLITTIILTLLIATGNVYGQKHPPHKPKHPVKHHKHLPPYHRYGHLPKIGVVFAPPAAAVVIKFGGIGFRFHEGIWYKPKGPDFVVVRPPVGVRIKVLPPKHRVVVVNKVTYYYYYGTYYKKVEDSGEYEVVDQPIGAIVDALPEGYETKTIDGTEYSILDGVYYKAVDCDDGTCYQSVKKPE
jgi:hypothetical protein